MVSFGDLIALVAALGWATTTVMARYISRAIPSFWYNAIRILIAAVAMLAIAPWSLTHADLSRLSLLALVLLLTSVLTGFALGDTAFFESMRRIGVARAAPIAGIHPLVTALLAVAFLGEPVTAALVLGILIISVGVWLITTDRADGASSRHARDGMLLGVVLALVAAVGWAASTVMVQPALHQVDAVTASTIRLPFAAVTLLLVARRLGKVDSRRLVLARGTVLWLVVAGLLTVISATLYLVAVEYAGAARAAALSSVSPLFSAGIAVAFLGERITRRLALGMGVSLAGVLAIVLEH